MPREPAASRPPRSNARRPFDRTLTGRPSGGGACPATRTPPTQRPTSKGVWDPTPSRGVKSPLNSLALFVWIGSNAYAPGGRRGALGHCNRVSGRGRRSDAELGRIHDPYGRLRRRRRDDAAQSRFSRPRHELRRGAAAPRSGGTRLASAKPDGARGDASAGEGNRPPIMPCPARRAGPRLIGAAWTA